MAAALAILQDEKATAVRQALSALREVVPYKKELWEIVRQQALSIDCLRYQDTMHSLIARDIQALLEKMV